MSTASSDKRIYGWRNTASSDCKLCSSMGLARTRPPHHSEMGFQDWLISCHYSSRLIGCGGASDRSALLDITCWHKHNSPPPKDQVSWLIFDEIDSHVENLLRENGKAIGLWIPARKTRTLSEQVRQLPRSIAEKLFIHWPHFSDLHNWGWSWATAVKEQEHLSWSFPYVNWRLPEGWDYFNSEADPELETAPRPDFIIDQRNPKILPKVSVILPTYNNFAPLRSILENLKLLRNENEFEIIVCDDGSFDQTQEWILNFSKENPSLPFIYLKIKRDHARTMGGGGFRAGIARNTAAVFAKGDIILFQDSDILIPHSFIDEISSLHERYDLLQPTRRQLLFTADHQSPKTVDDITGTDFEEQDIVWSDFHAKKEKWNEILDKWKYVSTFCLSIKKKHFFELGGFKTSFNKYGFEDTDLGYRAAKTGLSFYRMPNEVYHFKHEESRSEYRNDQTRKQKLLKDSAKIFFLNHLHRDILRAFPLYLEIE